MLSEQKYFVEDTVWAFNFPEEGCGGFNIGQIELVKYCASANIGSPFMDYAFKTKHEALEAMRKKLMDIENDNSI